MKITNADDFALALAPVAALPAGSRVLLVGTVATGKIGFARHLAARLPAPDPVVQAWIRTGAGLDLGALDQAPFRAPHHTCSAAGLVGTDRRPGEVHLAHGGVLLLDELPEFRLAVLDEVWRVLRAGFAHGAPARPRLVVGTASPCPCGWGWGARDCRCTEAAKRRHAWGLDRLPFAERIDFRLSAMGARAVCAALPVL